MVESLKKALLKGDEKYTFRALKEVRQMKVIKKASKKKGLLCCGPMSLIS